MNQIFKQPIIVLWVGKRYPTASSGTGSSDMQASHSAAFVKKAWMALKKEERGERRAEHTEQIRFPKVGYINVFTCCFLYSYMYLF